MFHCFNKSAMREGAARVLMKRGLNLGAQRYGAENGCAEGSPACSNPCFRTVETLSCIKYWESTQYNGPHKRSVMDYRGRGIQQPSQNGLVAGNQRFWPFSGLLVFLAIKSELDVGLFPRRASAFDHNPVRPPVIMERREPAPR